MAVDDFPDWQITRENRVKLTEQALEISKIFSAPFDNRPHYDFRWEAERLLDNIQRSNRSLVNLSGRPIAAFDQYNFVRRMRFVEHFGMLFRSNHHPSIPNSRRYRFINKNAFCLMDMGYALRDLAYFIAIQESDDFFLQFQKHWRLCKESASLESAGRLIHAHHYLLMSNSFIGRIKAGLSENHHRRSIGKKGQEAAYKRYLPLKGRAIEIAREHWIINANVRIGAVAEIVYAELLEEFGPASSVTRPVIKKWLVEAGIVPEEARRRGRPKEQ
ncbi:MAG: hypothetical protein ABFE02_11240 [Sulfuricella sp.]